MRKLILLCALMLLCSGCLLGCTFLTPEVLVEVTPGGTVRYLSQQETDMRVGPIDFQRDPDGTTRFTAGTSTQPAFAYGSTAVGVIDANTQLILAEVEMAKTVGPNIEQAMTGIAKAISAASWIGQVFGVSDTGLETLTAPLTDVSGKLAAMKQAWANYQAAKAACNAAGTCQ